MTKDDLSPNEFDAIYWASVGKSQSETAEIIGMTRPSVGRILSNAFNKLGAANVAGAIGICFRHGILKIENNEGRFE